MSSSSPPTTTNSGDHYGRVSEEGDSVDNDEYLLKPKSNLVSTHLSLSGLTTCRISFLGSDNHRQLPLTEDSAFCGKNPEGFFFFFQEERRIFPFWDWQWCCRVLPGLDLLISFFGERRKFWQAARGITQKGNSVFWKQLISFRFGIDKLFCAARIFML